MKHKHFYTHLVEINDIMLDLGELEMSKEERLHLLSLIDANIHAAVLHTVLSELSGDEKKVFLANLVLNDHKKTWTHLKNNCEDLEEKIKSSIWKTILEMRGDIKGLKNSE